MFCLFSRSAWLEVYQFYWYSQRRSFWFCWFSYGSACFFDIYFNFYYFLTCAYFWVSCALFFLFFTLKAKVIDFRHFCSTVDIYYCKFPPEYCFGDILLLLIYCIFIQFEITSDFPFDFSLIHGLFRSFLFTFQIFEGFLKVFSDVSSIVDLVSY